MNLQNKKVKLLFFISYFGDALFSCFIALFFSSVGLTNTQTGLLLAIMPLGALLGNFIFKRIAKTIKRNMVIMHCASIALFIVIAIFGFGKNFYLLLALTILYSLFNNPFFVMCDGISVEIANEEKIVYSSLRVFGSLGYMMACVANTFLLKLLDNNFKIIFIISGCIYLLTCLYILRIDVSKIKERKEDSAFKYNFLKNKKFIFAILFYIFCYSTVVVGSTYCPLFYKSIGMSNSMWAVANVYRVGIEIVMMFVCKKIFEKSHNYRLSLILSGLCWCVCFALVAIIPEYLPNFLIAFIFRGVGTGFFLYGFITHLSTFLPKEVVTKGNSLAAVFYNLTLCLGNYFTPYLTDAVGYNVLFYIIAACCFISIFFLIPYKELFNKKLGNN